MDENLWALLNLLILKTFLSSQRLLYFDKENEKEPEWEIKIEIRHMKERERKKDATFCWFTPKVPQWPWLTGLGLMAWLDTQSRFPMQVAGM